jgi:hypothetical protein
MSQIDPERLVDFSRYPIDQLDHPVCQSVVAEAQKELNDVGLCLLPEFLLPATVETMVGEVNRLKPQGFFRDRYLFSCPQDTVEPSIPPDHPIRARRRTTQRTVVYDLFPPDSFLRQLYEWNGIPRFLSAVLRQPVYCCADPLLSLAVTIMGDGEQHGWHFDDNDYVVSIMLQPPERDGEFQFVPWIRGEEDEYPRLEKILLGSSDEVMSVHLGPGTFALFRGRRSIHRVAPISGPRDRLIALLSYDSRPGMVFSPEIQMQAAGRTASTSTAL